MAQGRAVRIESGLTDQLTAPAVMGNQLGQTIQAGGRNPQRLSHFTDSRPVAVADHIGHHGGALAPILLIHVLDHFFPAVVLDVQVDVGRLGPLPGQKTLEKEVDLGRVHAGDPQSEADHRIGGRPPALTEDAVTAAVLDDLVHGQEVAFVLQFPDQLQLLLQLWNLAPELLAQAAGSPFEGPLPQVLAGGLALRQSLQRITVTQLPQREGTAGRHLPGPLDRLRIVGKKRSQFTPALQGVLVVGWDDPPGGGERHAFPDAGQNVLQAAPLGRVIEDLHGGHRGQLEPVGQFPEPDLRQHFFRSTVPGDQDVESILESCLELLQNRFRSGFRIRSRMGPAAPEGNQPGAGTADFPPLQLELSFGGTQMSVGQQAAEIAVAFPVPDQQHDLRSVPEADLGSDNQVDTQPAGANMGSDNPVDAVAIGERQGRNALAETGFDQLLGMAGPFQKGVVALAPEGNVGPSEGRLPGSRPAGSPWSGPGLRGLGVHGNFSGRAKGGAGHSTRP